MEKLKNDRYKSARGGSSQILELCCAKCGTFVCKYQKDGPGGLLRLYLDRLVDIEPPEGNLICDCCGAMLANRMIYKAENRPALRLVPGAVHKKKVK